MEARLAGSPIAETIPSHSGDTDRKPDLRQAGDQSFEKTGNVPSFTDLPSMPEERRRQLPECIRPGKGFNLLPSEGLAQLGIAAGSEGFRRGYGGGSLFGKACFSEAEVAVFSAPHSPSFSFQCPIGLLSPDTPDPFLDVSQGSLLLRSREATCLSHFISSHCGRFQSCRGPSRSFKIPRWSPLNPLWVFCREVKAVEAIEKLQNPKVVSPQPIWVFCREDKRSFYNCGRREDKALPGVEEVRTYAPGRTWENLKTVLALARSRVEVVSSIFSPQPAFRLQKLLFVLLPARHRLAFNQEDLNCYYLKGSHDRSGADQPSVWGTLLRVLLTRSRRGVRPTLFFPTAEDSKAAEVIQRLQDPKIAAKSIVVFCREDKRLLYEDLPTVEAVWTYAPGSSLRHLMMWVRLLRTRVDLVCAIFSGRPTFRLQKFLFLTLRARNRLVFNEDLNCYMLRGHLARFLQPQGRNRGLDRSVLILVVRKVLKWFLFVPRFLYLILWAAVVTMRARRRISQERSRANFRQIAD